MLSMDVSRSERRMIVRFLVVEGDRNADIYRRIVTAYGNHSLGHMAVNKCCNIFHEGWQTTSDLPRQANKAKQTK